jgi:hypothetical protein
MTAPTPIIWNGNPSGSMAPAKYCQSLAMGVVNFFPGYPTSFQCTDGKKVSAYFVTSPSCSSKDFTVNFTEQVCTPTETVFESLLALPKQDAIAISLSVCLLWAVAWLFKQAGRFFAG